MKKMGLGFVVGMIGMSLNSHASVIECSALDVAKKTSVHLEMNGKQTSMSVDSLHNHVDIARASKIEFSGKDIALYPADKKTTIIGNRTIEQITALNNDKKSSLRIGAVYMGITIDEKQNLNSLKSFQAYLAEFGSKGEDLGEATELNCVQSSSEDLIQELKNKDLTGMDSAAAGALDAQERMSLINGINEDINQMNRLQDKYNSVENSNGIIHVLGQMIDEATSISYEAGKSITPVKALRDAKDHIDNMLLRARNIAQ